MIDPNLAAEFGVHAFPNAARWAYRCMLVVAVGVLVYAALRLL